MPAAPINPAIPNRSPEAEAALARQRAAAALDCLIIYNEFFLVKNPKQPNLEKLESREYREAYLAGLLRKPEVVANILSFSKNAAKFYSANPENHAKKKDYHERIVFSETYNSKNQPVDWEKYFAIHPIQRETLFSLLTPEAKVKNIKQHYTELPFSPQYREEFNIFRLLDIYLLARKNNSTAGNITQIHERVLPCIQNPPASFTKRGQEILKACATLGIGKSIQENYDTHMHIAAQANEQAEDLLKKFKRQNELAYENTVIKLLNSYFKNADIEPYPKNVAEIHTVVVPCLKNPPATFSEPTKAWLLHHQQRGVAERIEQKYQRHQMHERILLAPEIIDLIDDYQEDKARGVFPGNIAELQHVVVPYLKNIPQNLDVSNLELLNNFHAAGVATQIEKDYKNYQVQTGEQVCSLLDTYLKNEKKHPGHIPKNIEELYLEVLPCIKDPPDEFGKTEQAHLVNQRLTGNAVSKITAAYEARFPSPKPQAPVAVQSKKPASQLAVEPVAEQAKTSPPPEQSRVVKAFTFVKGLTIRVSVGFTSALLGGICALALGPFGIAVYAGCFVGALAIGAAVNRWQDKREAAAVEKVKQQLVEDTMEIRELRLANESPADRDKRIPRETLAAEQLRAERLGGLIPLAERPDLAKTEPNSPVSTPGVSRKSSDRRRSSSDSVMSEQLGSSQQPRADSSTVSLDDIRVNEVARPDDKAANTPKPADPSPEPTTPKSRMGMSRGSRSS